MDVEKLCILHGPEKTMQVLQYLYYVKCNPAISDYEYDMFCRNNDLFGGGGSDREESYSDEIKELVKEYS